jgi:hypothetical protein
MKTDKALYHQLRHLSCKKLWYEEVARFDLLSPEERIKQVALIRAVGTVFSESGTTEQKDEVRSWLIHLLKDPSEKIRRYAMTALPKLGSGELEEKALLSLLRTTEIDREKKYLGQTLDKIGGEATLDAVAEMRNLLPQTEQKVKAVLARKQTPSVVRMDRLLSDFSGLRIHLHCRTGLEDIVRDEVNYHFVKHRKFRIVEVRSGLVLITQEAPFSLSDIYTLRCFATAGFFLGHVKGSSSAESADALASVMTSPLAQSILTAFTEGSIRYRMEFVGRGHQRGAVRMISNKAYILCPDILNDPQSAPWSMDFFPSENGISVELRAKLTPDPRFSYRKDDIQAASHPPLAASMARLAGLIKHEIVWDPFCGSGLELIERALLGGVQKVYGTDLSPDAIAVCRTNCIAAKVNEVQTILECCDFREYHKIKGLGPECLTLIITNPPMGRRIRVPNIRGLIGDLFSIAERVLKPGGRLVFPNPLQIEPSSAVLRLEYRKIVDLGGFECRLEMYVKREDRR